MRIGMFYLRGDRKNTVPNDNGVIWFVTPFPTFNLINVKIFGDMENGIKGEFWDLFLYYLFKYL